MRRSGGIRPAERFLASAVWFVALLSTSGAARADHPTIEYQVKASYLYNFLRFVEWPEAHGELPEDAWTLAVVGPNRFGEALDALEGQSVRGRPIVVRRFQRVEDVQACHVLFFSDTREPARALPQWLRERPVLTVGEREGFLETGGIISFTVVHNRVRFEIDREAARRAGLRIGAQLLALGVR